MRQIQNLTVILTTSISLLASSQVQVASDYALQQKYGAGYLHRIPTELLGNAWTKHDWSDPSGTFSQVRVGLEAVFRKPGFDAGKAFNEACQIARKKPFDSLAQFRCATLGFLIARREAENGRFFWDDPQENQIRGRIRWGLALAPNPSSAEYDRIRFIFEAPSSKTDLFRDLGNRLVAKWPKDEALLRSQASNLALSKQPKDLDKAILIALNLQREAPKNRRYIAFVGDIYRSAWVSLQRRSDGLACIAWTERYLKQTPAGANRDALRLSLESIRRQLGLTKTST